MHILTGFLVTRICDWTKRILSCAVGWRGRYECHYVHKSGFGGWHFMANRMHTKQTPELQCVQMCVRAVAEEILSQLPACQHQWWYAMLMSTNQVEVLQFSCGISLNLAIVYKWVGLLLWGSECGMWVWCHVTCLEVDMSTYIIRSCLLSHLWRSLMIS